LHAEARKTKYSKKSKIKKILKQMEYCYRGKWICDFEFGDDEAPSQHHLHNDHNYT